MGGEGCVIVRERGNQIVWKQKCESCGKTQPGEQHSSKPSSGATYTSGFMCAFCGEHQDVRIYG
jgi:hypothetical protein